LSELAMTHISASVTGQTRSRRKAIVEDFKNWLISKGVSTFDGTHVLNYLSELPEGRLGDFNMIRSAINTTVHQNSGYNYSELLLFQRHARGLRRLFPLDPGYAEMWNINQI